MHRLDLDGLRALVPHIELETVTESTPRVLCVRGRMRELKVQIRFLIDPHRDPKGLVRLQASLAARGPLRGPGLVPVLEAHPEADPPYVVEEAVAGEPFDRALDRGNTPDPGRMAHDLAVALAALAERRLVHGAISAAHVRIAPDGSARLGGLASARISLPAGDPERAVQEAYAPPEELAGHSAGAPGDMYAMALVLCEAAAGLPLFAPGAPVRVTPATRLGGWLPPRDIELRLGGGLAPAVCAALDLKPAQRPRPAWFVDAAAEPVRNPIRTALAFAPAVLVMAALVFMLVTSAMRDLSVRNAPRRANSLHPVNVVTPVTVPSPVAARPELASSGAARASARPVTPATILIPDNLDALLREANRLRNREEDRAALALFRRALVLAPDSADVRGGMATCQEALGQLEDAEASYRAASKLAPREAWITLRLGHLRAMRGDLVEAEKLSRASLAILPGYSCGKVQLVRVLRGKYPAEAAELIGTLIGEDPKSGHQAAHLGYLLWWAERMEEAEPYVRRGLEDVEAMPSTHVALVQFLEEQRRDADAMGVALNLVVHEPKRADVRAILSRLHARQGHVVAAAGELEAAQRLNPETAQDLSEIARTLVQTNSTPERAQVLLERTLEIDPLCHSAWEDLAVVHVDEGRLAEARKAAQSAQAIRPACHRCGELHMLLRTLEGEKSTADAGGPSVDSIQAYRRALQALEVRDPVAARKHLAFALEREPGNRLFTRLAVRIAGER